MILKYPLARDKVQWNKRNYPPIPDATGYHSGYDLIGVAEDTFNLYVAFTNEDKDQLWIEKTSKLAPDPLRSNLFNKIDDEEEFSAAHSFFIGQGILDGT